jgi:tyrosyl-tRNA synthetase
MDFIDTLQDRGLVAQMTHESELRAHLNGSSRVVYAGFDPTAPSLHVGHLMPIMGLRRFQKAGHRVIAIGGGGTALVGDPTGKSEMRQLLTKDQINSNLVGIKKQLGVFLDFEAHATDSTLGAASSDPHKGGFQGPKGWVLNNVDWLQSLNYLEFLRDIGPHFSVNRMLTAECFKQRLEKGLSFLEFNYMLLQSYDFLHLNRNYGCTIQIGGDDQWSNILGGMELIRRMGDGSQAFCLTMPLLTTTDGRKMGKTEKGAVWLDGNLTSPYEYFQYWRNVEDAKVGECLAYFTELPMDEVRRLRALPGAQINQAKEILAFETTKILHGEKAAEEALKAAKNLFGGGRGGVSPSGEEGNFDEPLVEISENDLQNGLDILELLRLCGLATSRGEARRLVTQGGVTLNSKEITDPGYRLTHQDFESPQGGLIRKGKKAYRRLKLIS